jgi:phosphoribosylanthranilate isomerase
MLLLDSGAGTGRTFEWNFIPRLEKPFFLAGGISEENLEGALSLQPFCVDISSGRKRTE